MAYFSKRLFVLILLFVSICEAAQSDDLKQTSEKNLAICSPYIVPIAANEIDYSNISKEFQGSDSSQFQQKFIKQLQTPSINVVFPNAYIFDRSFETYIVGYLYEKVIFQADMKALSTLIKLSEGNQDQVSNDAKSAIAFIHFQMNTDIDNQRGIDLIKIAIKGMGSYPAVVFWGRSHIWGEYYSKKDLKIAMNYLAGAGRIPGERREQNKSMDILNTQDIHTSTIKYLIENVPDMPYRETYEPIYAQGMEIINLQLEFKKNYSKSIEFKNIEITLADLNQLLSGVNVNKLFEVDKSLITASDWNLLNSILNKLDDIAKKINSSTASNAQQKELLLKIEKSNQKLQILLAQSAESLITQLKTSNEKFPQNVKALLALRSTQNGLSRSCSVSDTFVSKIN